MSTMTTNMNLILPTVGTEVGPTWATDLNADMSIIDQHDHSSGGGVQITPSGLNINADLPFSSNNATQLKTVRFTSQSGSLAGSSPNLDCVYVAGGELYYNDGAGNVVKITSSGNVNAGAGSITGLPSGTASATFTAGTFVWQSATNTPANTDTGSVILRNNTASSKGLTLAPPAAMAADFGLVLPNIPASTKIMALDNSGNMSAPYAVDNSTIEISANTIQVKSGGITSTQIADGTITGTDIASNTVSISNMSAVPSGTGLGDISISPSCGVFTTTNTVTFDNVTNLSISLTIKGNPVMVNIAPDLTVSATKVATNYAPGGGCIVALLRDGSAIATWLFQTNASAGSWGSSFQCIDYTAGAGTHSYVVQLQALGGPTAFMNQYRLFAYELK